MNNDWVNTLISGGTINSSNMSLSGNYLIYTQPIANGMFYSFVTTCVYSYIHIFIQSTPTGPLDTH